MRAGDSFTTRLSAYEVLNIETNQIGADLTGSRVQADAPVLVFGGSEASNAPIQTAVTLRPTDVSSMRASFVAVKKGTLTAHLTRRVQFRDSSRAAPTI